MHQYFIKTPWIVKQLFRSYVWSLPGVGNQVYLTFDDGPHPQITTWVLDVLQQHGAAATFFCIGKNVQQHPEVYARILSEGHAVGNHTQHHVNGWKVSVQHYLDDVREAATHIRSGLFRPPYGRIKRRQAGRIAAALQNTHARIIMWDVLSADFDRSISAQQCLDNVMNNVSAGSIIVFHDSEKAAPHLRYVLPKVLEELRKKNYRFAKLEG